MYCFLSVSDLDCSGKSAKIKQTEFTHRNQHIFCHSSGILLCFILRIRRRKQLRPGLVHIIRRSLTQFAEKLIFFVCRRKSLFKFLPAVLCQFLQIHSQSLKRLQHLFYGLSGSATVTQHGFHLIGKVRQECCFLRRHSARQQPLPCLNRFHHRCRICFRIIQGIQLKRRKLSFIPHLFVKVFKFLLRDQNTLLRCLPQFFRFFLQFLLIHLRIQLLRIRFCRIILFPLQTVQIRIGIQIIHDL